MAILGQSRAGIGWSAALGYADNSGNFTVSGYAYPGNIGTTTELWTVGGALVNPSLLVITVAQ